MLVVMKHGASETEMQAVVDEIERSDFRARSYRFDAVSVRLMPDGSFDAEHVEGAWTE